MGELAKRLRATSSPGEFDGWNDDQIEVAFLQKYGQEDPAYKVLADEKNRITANNLNAKKAQAPPEQPSPLERQVKASSEMLMSPVTGAAAAVQGLGAMGLEAAHGLVYRPIEAAMRWQARMADEYPEIASTTALTESEPYSSTPKPPPETWHPPMKTRFQVAEDVTKANQEAYDKLLASITRPVYHPESATSQMAAEVGGVAPVVAGAIAAPITTAAFLLGGPAGRAVAGAASPYVAKATGETPEYTKQAMEEFGGQAGMFGAAAAVHGAPLTELSVPEWVESFKRRGEDALSKPDLFEAPKPAPDQTVPPVAAAAAAAPSPQPTLLDKMREEANKKLQERRPLSDPEPEVNKPVAAQGSGAGVTRKIGPAVIDEKGRVGIGPLKFGPMEIAADVAGTAIGTLLGGPIGGAAGAVGGHALAAGTRYGLRFGARKMARQGGRAIQERMAADIIGNGSKPEATVGAPDQALRTLESMSTDVLRSGAVSGERGIPEGAPYQYPTIGGTSSSLGEVRMPVPENLTLEAAAAPAGPDPAIIALLKTQYPRGRGTPLADWEASIQEMARRIQGNAEARQAPAAAPVAPPAATVTPEETARRKAETDAMIAASDARRKAEIEQAKAEIAARQATPTKAPAPAPPPTPPAPTGGTALEALFRNVVPAERERLQAPVEARFKAETKGAKPEGDLLQQMISYVKGEEKQTKSATEHAAALKEGTHPKNKSGLKTAELEKRAEFQQALADFNASKLRDVHGNLITNERTARAIAYRMADSAAVKEAEAAKAAKEPSLEDKLKASVEATKKPAKPVKEAPKEAPKPPMEAAKAETKPEPQPKAPEKPQEAAQPPQAKAQEPTKAPEAKKAPEKAPEGTMEVAPRTQLKALLDAGDYKNAADLARKHAKAPADRVSEQGHKVGYVDNNGAMVVDILEDGTESKLKPTPKPASESSFRPGAGKQYALEGERGLKIKSGDWEGRYWTIKDGTQRYRMELPDGKFFTGAIRGDTLTLGRVGAKGHGKTIPEHLRAMAKRLGLKRIWFDSTNKLSLSTEPRGSVTGPAIRWRNNLAKHGEGKWLDDGTFELFLEKKGGPGGPKGGKYSIETSKIEGELDKYSKRDIQNARNSGAKVKVERFEGGYKVTLSRKLRNGEKWTDVNYAESPASVSVVVRQLEEDGFRADEKLARQELRKAIDITPSMREGIKKEGFPQYSVESDYAKLKETPGYRKPLPEGETRLPEATRTVGRMVKDAREAVERSELQAKRERVVDFAKEWKDKMSVDEETGNVHIDAPRGRIEIIPEKKLTLTLSDLEDIEKGWGKEKREAVERGELSPSGRTFAMDGKAVVEIVNTGELPHEFGHVFLNFFAHGKERKTVDKRLATEAARKDSTVDEVFAVAVKEAYKRRLENPGWQPKNALGRVIVRMLDFFQAVRQKYFPSYESTVEYAANPRKWLGRKPEKGADTGLVPKKYIVSPEQAKRIKMKTTLPDTDEFKQMVTNTPGAKVDQDGLHVNLVRFQKPEQAGSESVRTGVFYLPEGSPKKRYFKTRPGTVKSATVSYGGEQKISGETVLRNPLVVKGAAGGKAPEQAFIQLRGKDSFKNFQDEVYDAANGRTEVSKELQDLRMRRRALEAEGKIAESNALASQESRLSANAEQDARVKKVAKFLAGYGYDSYDGSAKNAAWNIVLNSTKGNQLRYAIQEHAIAQIVRDAGHDAVVGFSRSKNGPRIDEIFDVREIEYPVQDEPATLHEKFYSIGPKGSGSALGRQLAAAEGLRKGSGFDKNILYGAKDLTPRLGKKNKPRPDIIEKKG